jgi:hypothetical protein
MAKATFELRGPYPTWLTRTSGVARFACDGAVADTAAADTAAADTAVADAGTRAPAIASTVAVAIHLCGEYLIGAASGIHRSHD